MLWFDDCMYNTRVNMNKLDMNIYILEFIYIYMNMHLQVDARFSVDSIRSPLGKLELLLSVATGIGFGGVCLVVLPDKASPASSSFSSSRCHWGRFFSLLLRIYFL